MDAAAQKSLEQMRSFIIQEAKEKVQELQTQATEQYFIELNRIFEEQRSLINQEFARKNSQISVKRRMFAAY